MFKFKMLTKVLVAVFVLGQLIESNLKLCIAMSIDLDSPASSALQDKSWPPNADGSGTISSTGSQQLEPDGSGDLALAASQTLTSSSSTTGDQITHGADLSSSNQLAAGGFANISQTIESNGRLNYFGKIYVGEKQTPFMVLLDLSSSAFWLPSSECKSVYCISRQKYNKLESATHKDDGRSMEWNYMGNVQGAEVSTRLVRDRVTLAGITIEDQIFGEALAMEGEQFAHLPVDGFLGLGFRDLEAARSSVESVETPFESLLRRGLLKEPIFSLLVREDVGQYGYSADSGELILGKLAHGYEHSQLTYVPVTHTDFWEFHLTSVTLRQPIGGIELERACESACPAILDTGSSFISGHFTDVDRINKAMGGYPEGNGLYRLSHCDLTLMPNLVFAIGGAEFSLKPEEYVTVNEIRGNVVSCYSNLRVVKADQYPFWILGELFLKRHYIVFDYGQKRIGFVRSKMEKQESEEELYQRISRRKKHII